MYCIAIEITVTFYFIKDLEKVIGFQGDLNIYSNNNNE